MAVSNPASFSSIRAEFGGTGGFKDYYRGGPYVPIGGPAGISTTADGLRMSQFSGVTAYTPMTLAANNVDYSGPPHSGTQNVGNSFCSVTGGNTKTYSWAYISGDGFTITSPNTASTDFTSYGGLVQDISGVYRCTVSDGVATKTVDITVSASFS